MNSSFSKADIVAQLDQYSGKEDYQFPMLDHGYWYPVGARLSAYRDEEFWAILFEEFAYNPRGGAHGGIDLMLCPFGNCLKPRPTPHQVDLLRFTSDGPEGPTFFAATDGGNYVSGAAQTIRVRDQLLPVETDPAAYARNNIPLVYDPRIEPQDFLRLLYPRFREVFFAPDEQLSQRLSVELPLVLRSYGWQHPRVQQGELPSESPSILAIAEVLESGRVFDFVDPGVDNIDWRNWPEGGSL